MALPAVLLLPLALPSSSMCQRLVATPGTRAPLADLHSLLHLAHLPAPTYPITHGLALGAHDDMLQQCLTVELWALLWFGLALPLAALKALERQGRRLFEQQLAAGGAGSSSSGAWQEAEAGQQGLCTSTRCRIYLSSCWAFGLACASAAAWCTHRAERPL